MRFTLRDILRHSGKTERLSCTRNIIYIFSTIYSKAFLGFNEYFHFFIRY